MKSPVFKDNKCSQTGFYNRLFQPVDNSVLIIFRIIFGFLLFYHFSSSLYNGAVYKNFIQPPFTFTYIGFEFLQPLPGNGMYYYFGLMAFFGLMIMSGAWYRMSMILLTGLWTVVYLMQKADYNNHYYLMLLLCWIMIFMPANEYCSVDVKRKTGIKKLTCPQWVIWIFIAQVAILYFFAAISKISEEWFSGKYIAIQFSRLSTHHIVGIFYGQKWFQLLICYGGFFFDLLIVPLLLFKKTRKYAFLFSIGFHLFNSFTFRIGIFPYLAIALNLFFIEPEKLRSLFFNSKLPIESTVVMHVTNPLRRKLVIYGFGIYLFFQLILPMRSWLYPGNTFWTEEGYRMSWKMMMRTKSGKVYFNVVDPVSHMVWRVEPEKIFTPVHMMWLSVSPDIIWQYAQRIKKEFNRKGYSNVEVYAIGTVSLNRNQPMPLVNPAVNLAAVKWHPFKHSDWIMPYKKP